MIIIKNVEIVQIQAVPESEQNDLKQFFLTHGTDKIIELEDGRFCTFEQLKKNIQPADIRVKYGPDMFLTAISVIFKSGYAIADDEDGNHRAVLAFFGTTYQHRYQYAGGADLWFLDQYDCIFLHECNEYSVELCQTAFRFWKGKRLVLVGKDWEGLIPLLPDLPGIECFYEPEISDLRYRELKQGQKFLYIITGIPHSEPMKRYKQNIAYYDEVMSFTFLFSDYRELGTENEDKNFFVLDAYYGGLGLFALFGKVEAFARYVKSKGFIPVVRIEMSDGSFYSNGKGDDIWKKFYNQPEGYAMEDIKSSRHVFFSPGLYNGNIQCAIMEQKAGETALSWPDGIYNDRVLSYIKERQKLFLPYPDKTLGVLARGTDYVNTHLKNHSIHASKEQIAEKIDEVLKEWGETEYIYMSTEDAGYYEYFKERYGERIYFTDQRRYDIKAGETLSAVHSREDKKDGWLFGIEYILSINLLSKCNSLIASGDCWGTRETLRENNGNYQNVYIFDLGVNP